MLTCVQVAKTHFIILLCQENSAFQEEDCYILTNLLILNDSLDSKWLLLSWKLSVEIIITKNVCVSDFVVKMVKQENFFNEIDLSFDERFTNYYHFSLH